MSQIVNLTLTDHDCLNMRLALNAAAMEWGDKARAYRRLGDAEQAATCELIRSEYHRLWELVNVAQEEAPIAPRPLGELLGDAAAPVHNGFHPPGYDPSTCEACNDVGDTAPRMRSGDFMVAIAFSR
jgi:hypothetical protein